MSQYLNDIAEDFPDWPLGERTGGPPASPMDETFFEKWDLRQEALRTRQAIPGLRIEEDLDPPWPSSWTQVGPTGKIYVPPWASQLYAYYRFAYVGSLNFEGKIWTRVRIATNGTQFPFLELVNFYYATGLLGGFDTYSTVWSLGLDQYRGTVQNAIWEYKVEVVVGTLFDLDYHWHLDPGNIAAPWIWVRG